MGSGGAGLRGFLLFASLSSLGTSGCDSPPQEIEIEADAATSSRPADCAIIEVVARHLYRAHERPLPPIRSSRLFYPRCPSSRLEALSEPTLGASYPSVEFTKPTIEGRIGKVSTVHRSGPWKGTGFECDLSLEGDDWRLVSCRIAWLS